MRPELKELNRGLEEVGAVIISDRNESVSLYKEDFQELEDWVELCEHLGIDLAIPTVGVEVNAYAVVGDNIEAADDSTLTLDQLDLTDSELSEVLKERYITIYRDEFSQSRWSEVCENLGIIEDSLDTDRLHIYYYKVIWA